MVLSCIYVGGIANEFGGKTCSLEGWIPVRDFVECLENLLLISSVKVSFVGGGLDHLLLPLHFTEGGQSR